jgi:hypothetical protein
MIGRMLIVVNGVCEEFENDTTTESIYYGFSRTFLVTSSNSEFKIQNDMLVMLTPTEEQLNYIKSNGPTQQRDFEMECKDLLPSEAEKKSAKLEVLMTLTQCSREYCLELLQKTSFDIKVALACFNTYMNANEVPDDKFNFTQ